MNEVVQCKTKEQFNYVYAFFKYNWKEYEYWDLYKENSCINLYVQNYSSFDYYKRQQCEIYQYEEWLEKIGQSNKKQINKSMEKLMLDVLNKTYDNLKLRRKTVPLFMSNPGIGKTTIIRKFAETKGVKMVKITLSQRMPNEVAGGVMPDKETKSWEVYDNGQLSSLKDGDILFFDEVFNGTLKQTLDAALNLLEDRELPSGRRLADVMIVAASNHQGLINMTPQIKERFIKYDLNFDSTEFKALLKEIYGMPETVSSNICKLIEKEKFESNSWNYVTPRSIEKAINQIGCELESAYDDLLLPFLNYELESPMDIEAIKIKKGENVKYLDILKLIIKKNNQQEKKNNDNKNHKQKSTAASDILN